MNVTEFFQQSTGKWFSQRTHHHSTAQTPESGKSDIYIEWLENDAPTVVQLCQQQQVNPATALGGMQIRWEGFVAHSPDKQRGSTVVVAIADDTNPTQGRILQSNPDKTGSPVLAGHYTMGEDEALTLVTDIDSVSAEERIWFAGPNLRLRTRVLKTPEGVTTAAFYSEIRMGGAQ
ncbi:MULTISPECIES: phycobiliprotein lyase [unclassified Leptolyngbya]|uniref:phycobiliprotein lyase n=1 Tax=unclassified Leptolyngbya TaxID=2650499 RepID=UPI0016827C96|nr:MULTISPECIES: phycobiliprotein lyase [unclassified Leptolyngbya]MBD1913560.1 phycobiliprotein lyase [Leptolyngbya sp. FACHB-8]MBD2155869.1 phycobiliprotein lyase [Leptolyngbya sp. FACHB-16]